MLLLELFDRSPYQNIDDDHSRPLGDSPRYVESRKSKLVIAQLLHMLDMHDARAYEHARDLEKIQAQYKPPQQGGGLI